MIVYKRIILETVNIKDKEHKISDVDYTKKIWLFGWLVYSHTCTSKQNDVENKNKMGFKHK